VVLALVLGKPQFGAGDVGSRAEGAFALGSSIPTKTGFVAVTDVAKFDGMKMNMPMPSSTIPDMIGPNQAQVNVTASITNMTNHVVGYSPNQFRLLVKSSGKLLPPRGASVKPGALQPNANVEIQVKFVIPKKDADLMVQYRDPGASQPALVDPGHVRISHSMHM
jgi:hypothetical protein